tara:strand:+ start:460 stop:1038 length:579 start_codon:yes stop_codon:yes gene_type:complete
LPRYSVPFHQTSGIEWVSALSLSANRRNNVDELLLSNPSFTIDVGPAIFPLPGQIGKCPMAKILIADDDALIGEVVSHILEERGHDVAVVDNGTKALEMIRLERPDIIILDNLMPGLRGIEVFTKLQNRATTAAIPVIMLTAQTGRNHMVEAYDAGVTDYMTKPFEPECLVERISDMVDKVDSNSLLTDQLL